ncbi:MAG: prolipoprotein diacylglyceryl transferase [Clostridia bacterium]|nr:prolipoprotein diacylglyceryl transferase [Clostridia bacterium]MBQ8743519.1 prolipoprotein diacylglyceryl transferase [Clostridia bacterium]
MYFSILGKTIPLYGLFFYIGIFISATVASFISHKRSIAKFDVVGCGIFTMIGAGIGAKLLFVIVTLKDIIRYNIPIIAIIRGGFVFYGGVIGGLAGLLIYCFSFKMKAVDFLDLFSIVLPLGHAFGRIGCFFAGCCYGIEYHGPLSYTYTITAGSTPIGVPLLPIQLIEAFLLFVLFSVLISVFIHHPERKLLYATLYLLSYSVIRFILEFFRGDVERGSLWNLSTSQWISIVILSVTTVLSLRAQINRCHNNQEKEAHP